MSSSQNYHRFDDAHSGEYRSVAADYTALWKGHVPDEDHYTQVRAQLLKWQGRLGNQGIRPEDGALVICGPGFDLAHRDLSPEVVDGVISNHPRIVLADWSPEVLDDAHFSLNSASKGIAQKTVMTQRDFSHGLSSRFHALISSHLDDVRSVDDLRQFMDWIKNDVGVTEVQNTKPETDPHITRNLQSHLLNVDDAMDFESVLGGVAEVRFMTANMLLAGTLALTERDVRDCINRFYVEGTIHEDEMIEMLATWHRLIKDLNTKIATDFIINGLDRNPHARIYAPTDTNTAYTFDTFPRIDLEKMRNDIGGKGYKFVTTKQWTLDDRHETPSHSHQMQVLLACANGNKTSPDADDAGSSVSISTALPAGSGSISSSPSSSAAVNELPHKRTA